MKEFINNIKTYLNTMDTFLKVLIIGILVLFDIFLVIKIIKTHVNPKKPVFKIGQILLLLIFLAITVFVCIYV